MKAGKVWGTTEQVEANGALEFHRIEMNAGGVCSKHMHEFKWNGFFVESGKLKIKVWQKDYDLVDETIIGPGEYTKVKPGLYHQFECLESGVAFELYWAELSHNDIKRDTVGYKEEIISNNYTDITLTQHDADSSYIYGSDDSITTSYEPDIIKLDSDGYIEEDKSIDHPFSCTLLGEPLAIDLSDVDTDTITITVADD